MEALQRQIAELLILAVAFVDDGACPLIGLCAVLYPLAGALWGKSKRHERASLYAGSVVIVLYTVAALAVAPTFDATIALAISVRAMIAAVAFGMLAAVMSAIVQSFVLTPAREAALSWDRACQRRRAARARKVEEARRRQQEIDACQRSKVAHQSDQQIRAARDAVEARRLAATEARNAARYEFRLRYLAARPHLSERLSEVEFESLLQTTLEPTDPDELETRKAALAQLMDSFAQESIAKETPKSVEQLIAEFRRRHDEIDAADFGQDMKDKMHHWLHKEESQAISRFMMMHYE